MERRVITVVEHSLVAVVPRYELSHASGGNPRRAPPPQTGASPSAAPPGRARWRITPFTSINPPVRIEAYALPGVPLGLRSRVRLDRRGQRRRARSPRPGAASRSRDTSLETSPGGALGSSAAWSRARGYAQARRVASCPARLGLVSRPSSRRPRVSCRPLPALSAFLGLIMPFQQVAGEASQLAAQSVPFCLPQAPTSWARCSMLQLVPGFCPQGRGLLLRPSVEVGVLEGGVHRLVLRADRDLRCIRKMTSGGLLVRVLPGARRCTSRASGDRASRRPRSWMLQNRPCRATCRNIPSADVIVEGIKLGSYNNQCLYSLAYEHGPHAIR